MIRARSSGASACIAAPATSTRQDPLHRQSARRYFEAIERDRAIVANHARSRLGRESVAPITEAGIILGTPAFLAPELASGQGSFDGRADIYALGCVAFWLLTGRPPFGAGAAMSLLRHHSSTTPLPPSDFSEQAIPAPMDALVLECLSKEPALRPGSAEVLLARLSQLAVASQWDQRRARACWELHEPVLIEQA